MPIYEVKTDQGTFGIEANREPTPDEVLTALKAQPKSGLSSEKVNQQFGGRPSPLSRTENAGAPGELGIVGDSSRVFDLYAEAGIPMTAQAMATELTPAGQSLVGASTSALGNLIVQGRRMLMGEQDQFKPGELAQATLTGGIPFAGPARNAERVMHPILNTAARASKEAVKFAAYGAAGEEVKSLIDNGRLATGRELVLPTLLPSAVAGGATVVADAGRSLGSVGRRVEESAKDYKALGTTPTPGMLLPEEFAAAEAKKANNNPGTPLALQRDKVYGALKQGMQGVAPAPREGAEIFAEAKPLLKQISTAEAELGKLNTTAQRAQAEAAEAFAKLNQATGAEQAAMRQEAIKASDRALTENLNSALENARTLAAERIGQGGVPLNPAQARDLFVEHVAKPIEAAFEDHAAKLYSTVDNLAPKFDAAPILAKADEIAAQVTGGVPQKLSSAIKTVRDALGSDGPVSLQALRNARAEIIRGVRLGEFGSDMADKFVKDISHEITDQIDKQAVKALGEDGGNALLAANKFYRETRPLFDNSGAQALFARSPSDSYVTNVVNGMTKNGINSDEYQNLGKLIGAIGKVNPELGQQAQAHVNDLLRRSVLYDAARINPASATGELMVDGAALAKRLNELGKTPGTLEALNLGTPGKAAELTRLLQDFPEAPKLTTDQWNQLLTSPTFQETAAGKTLANSLAPVFGASQADSLLLRAANLDAVGKKVEAQRAYSAAMDTLSRVNGDVAAAKARYNQLRQDPVALALNNPGLGSSDFNSLARSLFEAKANKVTNSDVRAIADALEKSSNPAQRELLESLRERYIADRIAAYHSTPTSSDMVLQPEVKRLAEFFNPANVDDAANEIERARALLSPKQMSQLEDFAKAATALNKYEKMQNIAQLPGSKNVPTVGQVRRSIDVITDLYRSGKYFAAARWIANPEKFVSRAKTVQEITDFAEPVLRAGGMGAGREVSNEPPASR